MWADNACIHAYTHAYIYMQVMQSSAGWVPVFADSSQKLACMSIAFLLKSNHEVLLMCMCVCVCVFVVVAVVVFVFVFLFVHYVMCGFVHTCVENLLESWRACEFPLCLRATMRLD